MDKKYYFVLLGILIITIVALGLFFVNANHVNLDGTTFETPEGYKANSGEHFINFTKGENFIFIQSVNNTINAAMNEYLNPKNSTSYELSDFSLDGLKVYKVTLKNDPIVHFWFEKNHRIYEIFTWDTDETVNMDIMNLIKSAS